jgi:hypothetical protein
MTTSGKVHTETEDTSFQQARISMRQHPPFSRILIFLLWVTLAGATHAATQTEVTAEKIRIFFSGNVLAELGPCG